MSSEQAESFAWPRGWNALEDESARKAILKQLQRELPEGHVLQGLPAKAIARCETNDAVMFELQDGPAGARFALVHWGCKGEWPSPPSAQLFESLVGWVRYSRACSQELAQLEQREQIARQEEQIAKQRALRKRRIRMWIVVTLVLAIWIIASIATRH
jgi:hypothetical protein